MPFIDGCVVLNARVGADPGCPCNSVPEVLGRYGFVNSSVSAAGQGPIAARLEGLKKLIGHSDAVIGVLP